MNLIADFAAALRNWNAHRGELAQLASAQGDDWRKRTIEYRRLLQTDIAALTHAVDAMDGDDAIRTEVRDLRGALSALRACVAEHQARWPAVAIDRTDPAYQRSGADLTAASERFAATAAAIMAQLQRP